MQNHASLRRLSDRSQRLKTPCCVPSSQVSRESSDSPYPLLPSFYDEKLASNSASCSKASLVASSFASVSYSNPTSSVLPPRSAPTACRSLQLSFCGEDFVYDLDALEDDPKSIIELLKVTESERGKWMMAGVHYRNSGNADAAISVVESLIALSTTQGVPDADLKPAYLFLSCCETDLAKRAKASSLSGADAHYKRAQLLLQKVYGTQESAACRQSTSPNIPLLQPVQSITPIEAKPTEVFSHKSPFERELEALRSERHKQDALLVEMRAAKRKLEDDHAYECSSRRRLLRDYDDLQNELTAARKMENYALSQVKREVNARRKAEETARVEKGLRLELQSLVEQCTAPFNTMKSEEGQSTVLPSA